MQRKEYEQGSYGAYLVDLIKRHNFAQSEFAKRLNVSRTYLYDLFNGRVKPPSPDMQDRIVTLLALAGNERDEFFSKSAEGRNELPKDIYEFLYNNTDELSAIRERIRA